jgi:O-antigen/teichoic acid export membrane protein
MSRESESSEKFIIRLKTYVNSLRLRFTSRLSEEPLLKGILILGSGTAISQLLGIIFIPIITRMYPPAIYGTLAVFSSLISILLVVSTMRYDLTIPIAEKDDDAEYLVILSFLILSILTFILFVFLAVWGTYLAGIFHFEFLSPYYWLFCVGLFGASSYQILTFWALRSKQYILITRTNISQSIGGSVSKIILGIFSFGSSGLIGGEVIGSWVGIGSLGEKILPKIWRRIHTLDLHLLRALAYRYRKFPTYSMPSAFVNVIALQVPTLFLSGLYGFQIVGLFSLSTSMLIKPVSFVAGSISEVYTAECADLFRQKSDKLLPLFLDTTKKLFMFGAPVVMAAAVVAPVVFPIIFGSAWKDAGMFVLPLSIFVLSQFVVSSTDRLELYGYNDWSLAWNIGRTVLVLCGFYLSSLFNFSPITAIWIFSVIMTLMYVVCYLLNIKAITLLMKN